MRARALHGVITALSISAFACADPGENTTEDSRSLRKDNGGSNGNSDYCRGTIPCDSGEGDCDSNAECAAGLVCGRNNGLGFRMEDETWDVCVPPHCTNHVADGDEDPGRIDCGGSCGACFFCSFDRESGSSDYCTSVCPCSSGQGDCDRDADCQPGLYCGVNNGLLAGLPPNFEICVWPDEATVQEIELVNRATGGAQANGHSSGYTSSDDGRYVVFGSGAGNLAPDTNPFFDLFFRDRQADTTTMISVSASGAQGYGPSGGAMLSADGRVVTFSSIAVLTGDDANGNSDVFVRELDAGTIEIVSVDSNGVQANDGSGSQSISADGRFVAFASRANNLVPGDTNSFQDIFVRDRQAGTTVRVNVSGAGVEANSRSWSPSISGDGRFVAFRTDADNLVSGDTNGTYDIFVHDLQTGITERVSVGLASAEANAPSDNNATAFSGDGRFVVFSSSATNLVPNDTNSQPDIFVRDRLLEITTRVSVSETGEQANHTSTLGAIDRSGRYVVFTSVASNLVPIDMNQTSDIYVYDLQTARIALASITFRGEPGSWNSWGAGISGDGRTIFFESGVTDFVPIDTNDENDIFAIPNPL